VDKRAAIYPRTQFLYVAARTRGATVSDLYRLADAWQIWRHRRRHLIYITGAITDVGTGLRLYDVWQATTSPIHIVGH